MRRSMHLQSTLAADLYGKARYPIILRIVLRRLQIRVHSGHLACCDVGVRTCRVVDCQVLDVEVCHHIYVGIRLHMLRVN